MAGPEQAGDRREIESRYAINSFQRFQCIQNSSDSKLDIGTAPATRTTAAYNPPAVPSGVPHHLRAQTADNVDNWSEWATLFTLQPPKGRYPMTASRPSSATPSPADGSAITDFYTSTGAIPVPSAA